MLVTTVRVRADHSFPEEALRPVLLSLVLLALPALAGAQELMATPPLDDQISPFVRRIHQDHRGHHWFGTNGDGVARYDGERLEYFGPDDGFGGEAVRAIVEDDAGALWFATNRGLTRYDGEGFRTWREADGLPDDELWALEFDREGTLWVGSLEGAARFDGSQFTPFELPAAEPDYSRGVTSKRIVHAIVEDSAGQLWFATNGGAWRWDGEELAQLSVADGLCGNSVNDIAEAPDGRMWFATHHHGVCRWDGRGFEHFGPDTGVEGTEVWSLYRDSAGHLWFPVEHSGLYRFDGEGFTRFTRSHGLSSEAIQCVYEDREGRFWAGGYGGLQRLEGDSWLRVTKRGPWP